ncbi:hypothetical protein V1525DRAFT_434239 [Lipomyces kononenkoae]|uniref:Uncharacterized protein n=1 Tax=Lipomyces kononenkoae TaxID=34357 RepID=A0ACC3SW70_LIPKO
MLAVAIIGSGMAGPVLALSLHKHSIPCVLFELRTPDSQQGGNIALAPNALRVLDHLGIYDRLRLLGYNYEELGFTNGSGMILGKLWNGSQKVYNFPALRIHRSIVKEELIRECEKKGIEIRWGKKCTGVEEEREGSAVVRFEDGETVEAQFVVGADGIHSKIRPFMFPGTDPIFSGLMGVMGTVMVQNLNSLCETHGLDLPCMIFGAKGSFAIMPASFGGNELGYFATLEAKDRGRTGWQMLEKNQAELKEMLHERFLPEKNGFPVLVKELVEKTASETLTSWPFFSVPHLHSWSSPNKRIFVIGDAAHAIPPTGGQGAAMAFEDAETLAYVLARVLASDFNANHLSDIVSKWEHHRIDRIVKVVNFTTKNGDLRKSSPHYYEQAAKEWIIWATFKFMGPEGGAHWMYAYNAESVLGALA